jgi:hypothetical protein
LAGKIGELFANSETKQVKTTIRSRADVGSIFCLRRQGHGGRLVLQSWKEIFEEKKQKLAKKVSAVSTSCPSPTESHYFIMEQFLKRQPGGLWRTGRRPVPTQPKKIFIFSLITWFTTSRTCNYRKISWVKKLLIKFYDYI